jgi:DNA invertase Pin-like site-specific DNA recombinase
MDEATIILPQLDKELARRRNEQIIGLVKKGVRPADVARMFKISRQRVNQILRAEEREDK